MSFTPEKAEIRRRKLFAEGKDFGRSRKHGFPYRESFHLSLTILVILSRRYLYPREKGVIYFRSLADDESQSSEL